MKAHHLAAIAVEIKDRARARKVIAMIEELEASGYKVSFATEPNQEYGSVVGWLDTDKGSEELWVYVDRKGWLQTFLHERNHHKQLLEGVYCTDAELNMIQDFDDWLSHKIELPDDYLEQAVRLAQALELDCEIRTVEDLKDLGMDPEIPFYIKQSNCYVLSYEFCRQHRQDVPNGYIEKTSKFVPDHFLDDYTVLPEGYAEALL